MQTTIVLTRTSCLALLVGAALSSSACMRRNPLEPAVGANQVPGMEDAAVTRAGDVELVAKTETWPGSRGILDDVTPVWVEITNGNEAPLAVRYENFQLVAIDGTKYAAVPPFQTDGTATLPTPYATGVYPGFAAAPYYAPYAAPAPVVASPYPYTWYDPVGYDYGAYYDRYVTVELPTEEMIERALPEGALEPGATAAGFVYFQRVDDEEREVELRAELVNAKTNDRFAVASIPFRVDEFP